MTDQGVERRLGAILAADMALVQPARCSRQRGHRMRRRFFISTLGAAAVWPFVLHSQQSAQPLIGYLDSGSEARSRVSAFREGLAKAGYVQGQNVNIEYRWAEGRYERLSELATDLVNRQVVVIAATSTPPALAAKAATQTTPVVFTTGNDPVALGLVASLNRPGGNVTGVTRMNLQLGPKRLELLHEMVPKATIIGLLLNPSNPNADTFEKEVRAAADRFGLQMKVLHAQSDTELEATFDGLAVRDIGALLIGADPFFNTRSDKLAELAVRHGMPSLYQYRAFVAAGGLGSYSASLDDSHREVGIYVGRILAGAKPADLPVMQSTKLELIINLRTAKALGLTVPQLLLAQADEVIE
jgi:putative ABC transport system substrate-binding protein